MMVDDLRMVSMINTEGKEGTFMRIGIHCCGMVTSRHHRGMTCFAEPRMRGVAEKARLHQELKRGRGQVGEVGRGQRKGSGGAG